MSKGPKETPVGHPPPVSGSKAPAPSPSPLPTPLQRDSVGPSDSLLPKEQPVEEMAPGVHGRSSIWTVLRKVLVSRKEKQKD